MTPNPTTTEATSENALTVTRLFDAPVSRVYDAWTKPDLFSRWWVPRSSGATLRSCEQDVRVGGGYRLTIAHPSAPQPMAFFGRYVEVIPNARLVWTNDESPDGAVTTVTFAAQDADRTLLTMSERYPTREARDGALEGMCDAMPETFGQLDGFLAGGERG